MNNNNLNNNKKILRSPNSKNNKKRFKSNIKLASMILAGALAMSGAYRYGYIDGDKSNVPIESYEIDIEKKGTFTSELENNELKNIFNSVSKIKFIDEIDEKERSPEQKKEYKEAYDFLKINYPTRKELGRLQLALIKSKFLDYYGFDRSIVNNYWDIKLQNYDSRSLLKRRTELKAFNSTYDLKDIFIPTLDTADANSNNMFHEKYYDKETDKYNIDKFISEYKKTIENDKTEKSFKESSQIENIKIEQESLIRRHNEEEKVEDNKKYSKKDYNDLYINPSKSPILQEKNYDFEK